MWEGREAGHLWTSSQERIPASWDPWQHRTNSWSSTKKWEILNPTINIVLSPPMCSLFVSLILIFLSLYIIILFWFLMNLFFFSYIALPNTIKHICTIIIWVTMEKQYRHSGSIKNGPVQVDILKSGLWFQIVNISPIDVSETGQPGNQAPQLLVAWKYTWHLLFMRKHEKMFISVQIPCKNLRGKRSSASAETSSKLKCMFEVLKKKNHKALNSATGFQ